MLSAESLVTMVFREAPFHGSLASLHASVDLTYLSMTDHE